MRQKEYCIALLGAFTNWKLWNDAFSAIRCTLLMWFKSRKYYYCTEIISSIFLSSIINGR